MDICRSLDTLIPALTRLRAATPSPIALVPTMGALHAGHAALLTAARSAGAAVVASIFVNPLQFAAGEDFTRYPRDEPGDLALLRAAACAVAWLPPVELMYPPENATVIEVGGPALGFEAAARPLHFRGVATVCAKLFGQIRPDRAYFGEKDWQQLRVVSRMVADLCLPVEIVAVPTVRAPDGLALSSRNRYLTSDLRHQAAALPRLLHACAAAIAAGSPPDAATHTATAALRDAGFAPDYVAAIDASAVTPTPTPNRLIAAARLGPVRLLDTIPIHNPSKPSPAPRR